MARIIRTCSLVLCALLATEAGARRIEPSALGYYARARSADSAKQQGIAVDQYRAALTLDPNSVTIAFRAYRSAVEEGDYELALRSAQALDRLDLVPPDAQLMLYVAAVRDRDWRAARDRLQKIGAEKGFEFLKPLFGRWLDLADGVDAPAKLTAANAYAGENAALAAIANGNEADGLTAIKSLWAAEPDRATILRVAAAATLDDRGQRAAALDLLAGGDPVRMRARAAIAKKGLGSAKVDSPARGTAFVLARMSDDLLAGRTPRSAITLGRLATFADPDNPRLAIVAARALAVGGRPDAALVLIERAKRDSVYGPQAEELRIDLLELAGRKQEALAIARSRGGQSATELAQLADIEIRIGDPAAASTHYQAAIAAEGEDKASWQILLAAGSAADMAGDWATARPLLERALKLAPAEPRLLNQLGFGLADRGEDLPRALKLIEKASAAEPENAAITDSLGWAHFRLGNFDRAIPILEQALRLDGTIAEIGEHLGDAYWSAGRRIEARYAWAGARESAQGSARDRLTARIERGLP